MKAIRFNKLKNATIEEIVAMIPVGTNPNSKVFISTEKPLLQAELTIEQLETMLVVVKRNKLNEEVKILQATNPELFNYIKELGVIEFHHSSFEVDPF